jgi:type II secretory pathway pseudopilin PulG
MPQQHPRPIRSLGNKPSFLSRTPNASAIENNRSAAPEGRRGRLQKCKAVTLVEAMVALLIFAGCMLGFLATFIQSRTTTEDSVMNAACTNIVYGIIEQIKNLDYTTMLPNGSPDPGDPNNATTVTPTVRVQINQNTLQWLTVVYTPYVAPTTTVVEGVTTVVAGTGSVPKAPLVTPPPTALASDTNILAVDNVVGPLPLSSATGTKSQSISVHLWIWIDEIPDTTRDVSDVKRVTIV